MLVDSALFTDFYQITMLSGYFAQRKHQQRSVFELFFRKVPNKGGFCISAGLEQALDYLAAVRFSPQEIEYLRRLKKFPDDFLSWLESFRFRGSVKAVAEGTLVFPNEPILQLHASLPEAQLVESALLNIINFQTLIATKAARVCYSAGRPIAGTYQGLGEVLEFGLRRAQGPNGALWASRAAFVGGCGATSNAQAGFEFDIPIRGTQAHAWVMAFPTELEAFRAYADSYPDGCLLLVDTYDTLASGIPNAIKVGLELRAKGHELLGVRLDSGDLALLSREARQMLDAAGLQQAKIVASNDLDENIIETLRLQGACIDIWGVGTQLVTSKSDPALGGVYKLVEIEEQGGFRPTLKISGNPEKVTNPCAKQIWRGFAANGQIVEDFLAVHTEDLSHWTAPRLPLVNSPRVEAVRYQPLLTQVMENGLRCAPAPALAEVRDFAIGQLATLDEATQRFINPTPVPVRLTEQLGSIKRRLLEQAQL